MAAGKREAGAHCVPDGTPAGRLPRRVPAAKPPERAPPGRVYAPGFRLNGLALNAANFLSSGQPEPFPCQLRSRRLSDFGRNKFIFMLDKALLPVYDA